MIDREKVIEGLKEVQHYIEVENMPAHTLKAKLVIDDALVLLKAQEARVMTLEEAKSAFVIEYRSGKLKEAGMTILDLDVDPANAYYGEIYRVWTSRPTDEQREATPWQVCM